MAAGGTTLPITLTLHFDEIIDHTTVHVVGFTIVDAAGANSAPNAFTLTSGTFFPVTQPT